MYKVRINEAGWNHFNDYLGHIKFTNGVSDRELTDREIEIVGSSLKITRIDSEEQLGPATNMILKRENKAPILQPLESEKEVVAEIESKEEVDRVAETTDGLTQPVKEEAKRWTKEELEILASEKGIQGIREEAAKFGIKGVQIASLIEKILEAQDTKETE